MMSLSPSPLPSSSDVSVLIKTPYQPDYTLTLSVPPQTTVGELKSLLTAAHRSHPAGAQQRLISCGRLLSDREQISDVVGAHGGQKGCVIHLAIRDAAEATPPTAASPAAAAAGAAAASASVSSPPVAAPPSAPAATVPSAIYSAYSPSFPLAFHPYAAVSPQHAAFSSAPYVTALPHSSSPAASMTAAQQALYWQQLAIAMQQVAVRQRQAAAALAAVSSSPLTAAPSFSSFSSSLSNSVSHASAGAASAAASPSAAASTSSLHPAALTGFGTAGPLYLPPFAFPPSAQLGAQIPFGPAALPAFAQPPAAPIASPPAAAAPPSSTTGASTGSVAAGSAAGVAAGDAGAGRAAAPPSRLSRYLAYVRRYVDVRLLVKLCVLLLVFSRQGDAYRSLMLMAAAIVAYLWQVGLFRRREAAEGEAEAGAAAAAAADAGGAAGRDAMAQARREAREERRAGGGGLGGLLGGMGGEDEDDEEEDIAMQREQLHMLQLQHQAEMIRRGLQPAGGTAAAAASAADVGWIVVLEKFIVGFFASLVPSWRPTSAL